jgi:hypothetical protein
MSGPKARGTGVIERQTFRQYEAISIDGVHGGFVVGGILAFHSTDGFPYDLTLDIFREKIEEGNIIVLNPHDLMYEMCALGLYELGAEIGQRMYKDEWPAVYKRMHFWAAKHWSNARDENKNFDHDEIWGLMLVQMREELRAQLKAWQTLRIAA